MVGLPEAEGRGVEGHELAVRLGSLLDDIHAVVPQSGLTSDGGAGRVGDFDCRDDEIWREALDGRRARAGGVIVENENVLVGEAREERDGRIVGVVVLDERVAEGCGCRE